MGEIMEKIGQEQVHALLFDDSLSWQAILYDLITTEQLDPWDIDLALLTSKFLDKVRALEEANFFISSKVLLAASLLLRIKSDILLTKDLVGIDEILYGKKEEKQGYVQERIELEEGIPGLVPRTPLSRMKKVTLEELMHALGTAIKTENRRIRKEVILRQYEKEAEAAIPRATYNLKEATRDVYKALKKLFQTQQERVTFSELLGHTGADRIVSFVSLLHLDTQHKIWLEQEGHFEEIWILLKEMYEAGDERKRERLREELEALEAEHEREEIIEEVTGFDSFEEL